MTISQKLSHITTELISTFSVRHFCRPGWQVGMVKALHNIAIDQQVNIFTSEVNPSHGRRTKV
jgi:hypothetical protein